jgi:hypothetical protein
MCRVHFQSHSVQLKKESSYAILHALTCVIDTVSLKRSNSLREVSGLQVSVTCYPEFVYYYRRYLLIQFSDSWLYIPGETGFKVDSFDIDCSWISSASLG